MKKRWIALYVENNVGVLAKIAGLFSGKAYNLESLTVGTTEDETISRITLGANCNDVTYEQIKKQLNRMVDVIKVIDLTDLEIIRKELMFIKIEKVNKLTDENKHKLYDKVNEFGASIIYENDNTIIIESTKIESENNSMIAYFAKKYKGSIIRGGSVAVEV